MKVEMRDLILGVLAIEPTLTLKQVAERIGKSTSTVEKAVAVLVKDGVAVEMAITPPPHRSGRSLLTHPAPTSSHTAKSRIRIWMHHSRGRDPQG
ncbi:winged helix-turn-helix domain-containing protein [Aeromonas rivipollensis]